MRVHARRFKLQGAAVLMPKEIRMFRHSWTAMACLTAFLLIAAPARAQSPSPEAIAAAQELMTTMKMTDQIRALVPAILQNMKPAIVRNRPEVERDFDEIARRLSDGFNARANDAIALAAVIYARNFSVDELRELTAFYRAPLGQKVLQKLPTVMQESMTTFQRFGQEIGREAGEQMVNELRKRGHAI
jgi:uncharacterized protein